jgi:outer membrane protein assembly factor BamB
MDRRLMAVVTVVVGAVLGAAMFAASGPLGSSAPPSTIAASSVSTAPATTGLPTITTTSSTSSTTTTTTEPPRPEGVVPLNTVGEPWGSTVGLTMFRGNPTRSFYGTGPIPSEEPSVLWRYPDSPMCGTSTVGGVSSVWCGTGWTGQPAVWERPDGVTEVVFGAYDKAVHFVDAFTGEATREPFVTGDIIKGSLTIDPDLYPLLYTGSRDNKLRIVALDREPVEELWSLDAYEVQGMWNDDWDGNPAIVDDMLYVGGENSWFFAIRLNRSYVDGLVAVEPETVFAMPGWTEELLGLVGRNVSIESSVVVVERTVYFANSGGRIVGIDMDLVAAGVDDPVVFDFWAGDDIDATMVADPDGMLYVAIELERFNARSAELGQLISLDPTRPDDPVRWGVPVPGVAGSDGGIWATPAVADGMVYVPTHTGRLLAVDAATGEITWEDAVGFHAWSSPAVVDGRLLIGTCERPELRSYRLDDPRVPVLEWSIPAADGCIESTPAVWRGRIYVGSRDGYMRAYG